MRRDDVELALLGDPALAELSRADDVEAFAELWRRHASAGTAAARQFAAIADPHDIVSEAYLRILRALQQGGGPHEAFRPYLYRTIRNIALDWRARHPSVSLDETDDLAEPGMPMESTVLDNAVTAQAFEQLPERWQAVLWYLEVEGMTPSDAAPHLGLSPNATSVLARRAHEGFKTAWLQAHVNHRSVPAECRWTSERMGRYVRHGLSRRSRDRFDHHLAECERCTLLVHELDEIGGQLASVLLPLALGATAGSILLAQLRDGAVVTATPAAVTSGASVMTAAAAVVLITSATLLATAPTNQSPTPPPAATSAEDTESAPPLPASQSEQSTAVSEPEPDPATPTEPAAAVAEVVPVETPTGTQPPGAEPPVAASAPLVDLSVSLLSGAVELDAVVDLDPETGLLVELIPGLNLFGG